MLIGPCTNEECTLARIAELCSPHARGWSRLPGLRLARRKVHGDGLHGEVRRLPAEPDTDAPRTGHRPRPPVGYAVRP